MSLHIGVIPDGNRRYARLHPGDEGASERAITSLLRWAVARDDVLSLSIFGFSLENFGRAQNEVEAAMQRLLDWLRSVEGDGDICFTFIGRRELLPRGVRAEMRRLECAAAARAWRGGTPPRLLVCLYLAYGYIQQQQCCVQPPRRRHHRRRRHSWPSTAAFDDSPWPLGTPPPQLDCLVRTSGEHRLSNFDLGRMAYTELFFIPELFPECRDTHWDAVMHEHKNRQRRFGK